MTPLQAGSGMLMLHDEKEAMRSEITPTPDDQQTLWPWFHGVVGSLSRRALGHPLYGKLAKPEQVRVFMRFHVFAVWDFMCLLKTLQQAQTCVAVPWVPRGNPDIRRFINEIVLAEESDRLPDGRIESHFEMYLRAMKEIGADTGAIDAFVARVRKGYPVPRALADADAPSAAQAFVLQTMTVIESRSLPAIASAFIARRERVIPSSFMATVEKMAPEYPTLRSYFRRHIALDVDEHGPFAEDLLKAVCMGRRADWVKAEAAARVALRARSELCDAVLAELA
jgi:hypothetical protein